MATGGADQAGPRWQVAPDDNPPDDRLDARKAVEISDRALSLATAAERESLALLPALVARGDLAPGRLHLQLDPNALGARLLVEPDSLDPQLLQLSFAFALRRRGIETKLIVGDRLPEPDMPLLRALADTHTEMAQRRIGRRRADIEATGRATGSRMRRRSYLAFLSPRIQQAILAGRVPEGLSLEKLLRIDLPLD